MSDEVMRLETDDDLKDFAFGASFLAAGGGGDPYVGRLMLKQQVTRGKRVTVVPHDQVPDDAFIVSVATMGAPTVMIERIPSAEATVKSLEAVEQLSGRKVTHICGVEVGGINGTLPMVTGAITGLPVIDGDGMGRAFPELQMVTFGIGGVKASPVVLQNEVGDKVAIWGRDNTLSERLARAIVVDMKGMAQIALYPMTGAEFRETCVPATMSLAKRVGTAARLALAASEDPAEAILDLLNNESPPRFAKALFSGKIIDLKRETRRGFAVGEVILDSIDGRSRAVITFQNEFLTIAIDGRIVAMVPDIITLIDFESAAPLTTDRLRYGQRLRVMGVQISDILRTPAALGICGPRAFGLGFDFTPIEQLAS